MSAGTEEFDVAVVGARCAGAPLAAMLAERGARVCLIDRSRFPSDSLSTHVIQPCGVRILERLGVAEAMLAAGAVPLSRFSLLDEDVRIEAEAEGGAALGLCLRRLKLDHLLVETAAAAGVAVHTETAVTDLLCERDRIVGVRTGAGEVRARLVVGADGRSSTVARLAGASRYRVEPPARLFSWAYFEGVPEDGSHLRLGNLGGVAYLACPTDSGLFMAGVCPPIAARETYLADREAGFRAGLERWPELADLLADAIRVGPIRVLADWHGYFRQATGPGWVLLGDAGHFKDPTTAQGISDALRQAERLAEVVASNLDADTLDHELRRWWRWRDKDAHEMYGFATDSGSGASPLLSRELLRDLAVEPGGGHQFLRVLDHELAPSRLFTLPHIGRSIARALRERPALAPAIARDLASAIGREARRYRPRRPPWRRPLLASRLERLLLGLTIIGLLLPNLFFATFFSEHGLDLGAYLSLWIGSLPSTQLLLDLTLAALTLFVWASFEGRRARIRGWWLCIPAALLVGLCFALPLFLLMRERALHRPNALRPKPPGPQPAPLHSAIGLPPSASPRRQAGEGALPARDSG